MVIIIPGNIQSCNNSEHKHTNTHIPTHKHTDTHTLLQVSDLWSVRIQVNVLIRISQALIHTRLAEISGLNISHIPLEQSILYQSEKQREHTIFYINIVPSLNRYIQSDSRPLPQCTQTLPTQAQSFRLSGFSSELSQNSQLSSEATAKRNSPEKYRQNSPVKGAV